MTTQSFLARLQSGTVRYSKSIFITLVSLFSLFTATAVNASTIVVPAGGDLQAAIDAAHFGDTIILQANATYNPRGDSFVLPNKGLGTGTDADYITIQTSGLANIAAAGQRIAPQTHASSMARLVGATGYPVLVTSVGAHHYKFIGIEITTTGNPAIYTPDLVNFGSYFSRQERISTHHFVFDRTFIHTAEISGSNLFPSTLERTSGRGIAAGVTEMWIINSYIAGFAGKYPSATPNAGQNIDSYGVYADAGPGPLHINNNYIEAQFNNVFIGGAGMTTTNVATVTNPTLTSATLSNVNNLAVGDLVAFPYSSCTSATGIPYAKPWQTGKVTSIVGNNIVFTVVLGQYSCPPGIPDNNGTARWNGDHIQDVEIRNNFLNKPDVWNAFSSPKAWVEIKEVRNGVIDGNDMYSGIGTAIAATVRNQDGGSPWSTIENLSITNNRVRGYKWGFSLMLTDNEQPSVMGSNITIQNNLFDLPKPVADSPTNFVQLVGGHDITIRHNTLVQPGNPLVGSLPTPNLVFKDNIVANYQYGMQCTVVPYTLSSCWSNLVMTGNVVIDTRWNKGDGPLSGLYPAGNFYPNDAPSVGFVDAANGNFALSSSSAYKGRASDGTDPGVNMTTLLAALGGSVSPTPTPTPTPSPTVTPTPTPTPTATPTPTPTPTPSPTPSITVNVTSPSNNSTFALGSNVTLTATASKQGGVISNVKFVANTQAVGTSTVSPYSTVWTNPAAGNYTVTAVATDNTGASVTSTSIIVKISKSLKAVRNGKGSASAVETTLTSGGASSANGPLNNLDQMDSLVTSLNQAYADFTSEREMFTGVDIDIDKYLYVALYLAKSSASLSRQSTPASGVVDRLNKIDSYLSFCEDLMVDGVISRNTLNKASKNSARTDIAINQADVLPLDSNGINLQQSGMGAITSPTSSPLTSETEVASTNDKYELGGVSVTIGGEAVPMISVSPTAITFYVPSDLNGGLADVVITTRDGYVMHSTASMTGLNPTILVWQGESNTAGAILNALELRRDGFSPITSGWLGGDLQARLSILTTGLSSGLTNRNVGDDVWLSNGKVVENYAEDVQVEFRTADNRVFTVPVEFAGSSGTLRGLDQVTVKISPELVGAGSVQLTVIAGGRRSNMSVVTIN